MFFRNQTAYLLLNHFCGFIQGPIGDRGTDGLPGNRVGDQIHEKFNMFKISDLFLVNLTRHSESVHWVACFFKTESAVSL